MRYPRKSVFSCYIGKRILSICASEKANADQYMEYRFGTSQKIEMRFKGKETDWPKRFNRAEVLYASNASTVIWFEYKTINYLLEFPMRGGPELVVSSGDIIAKMKCNDGWANSVGDPDSPSKFIATQASGYYSELHDKWWAK
jgi:hypothetical protein